MHAFRRPKEAQKSFIDRNPGLIPDREGFFESIRGAADQFVGAIRAVAGLQRIGRQFAPEVIDVYGELIAANPRRVRCGSAAAEGSGLRLGRRPRKPNPGADDREYRARRGVALPAIPPPPASNRDTTGSIRSAPS
jgi:hypothetical protein